METFAVCLVIRGFEIFFSGIVMIGFSSTHGSGTGGGGGGSCGGLFVFA